MNFFATQLIQVNRGDLAYKVLLVHRVLMDTTVLKAIEDPLGHPGQKVIQDHLDLEVTLVLVPTVNQVLPVTQDHQDFRLKDVQRVLDYKNPKQ